MSHDPDPGGGWETWKASLRGGVIAAVPLLMTAAGRVDHTSADRYRARMDLAGLAGVAVWAHTGRGPHLKADLRRDALGMWRGSRELVAGIGVHDTAPRDLVPKAMQLAEEAARAGATSLLIHPPRALAGSGDRRLVDYHAALGEFGLPLIAFELYRAAAGLTYSDLVWRELFEMPAVAAVKFATLDSPMRVQDLVALARGTGTMLITGEDRFLGASLMYGCEAALVGVAAARPRLTVELVDAWMTGDFARFRSASSAVDEFAGETFRAPMEGYIRRLLEVLVVDGWIEPSATADPWGPVLDDVDLARIRSWAIATRFAHRPVGSGLD